MLSSVNLPEGEHRRRTYEDQLNMRTLFVEGDLVSAEIHQVEKRKEGRGGERKGVERSERKKYSKL
eukprot:766798-Hanusia_phi.AAC.4